jgi:antirestriction protein ArdC
MPVMRWRNLSRKSAQLFYAPISASRRRPATTTPPISRSWLKVLKDDKRAIFTAASHAQKAADYLHGLQPQTGTASAEQMRAAA